MTLITIKSIEKDFDYYLGARHEPYPAIKQFYRKKIKQMLSEIRAGLPKLPEKGSSDFAQGIVCYFALVSEYLNKKVDAIKGENET